MKSKNLILALLALLFLCPGIAAYWLYTHPSWLDPATTNKGRLLAKPEFLGLQARGKWGLILWEPSDASDQCRRELERLAKVRLALGRQLYQVEEILVLGRPPQKTRSKPWIDDLRENDIAYTVLSLEEQQKHPIFGSAPGIFIADPEGQLVLSYETGAKSEDIFHDLTVLLKVGHSKGQEMSRFARHDVQLQDVQPHDVQPQDVQQQNLQRHPERSEGSPAYPGGSLSAK